MDADGSHGHERTDKEGTYSGEGLSYFRQKRVILTYGLLGLSYVLILALFIKVLTRSSRSEASEIASMNELNNMKNNVTDLTEKMSNFETALKKSASRSGASEIASMNELNNMKNNVTDLTEKMSNFETALKKSASRSGASEIASMNELNNMKNNVTDLTEKMSNFETSLKKSGPSCDSEWLRLNGNCYYFSVTKWNWRKSRFLCVTKGSDLAVINDDMEQRFISLITFGQCYWIGLSYKEDEGGWSWVDGTDYNTSYKSWNTSKRNDLGKKEECAQLSVYGEWNNVQCSYNQCYAVCEMKQ